MKKSALGVAMFVAFSGSAMAQSSEQFYLGGGLSLNTLSGWDNAVGYQVFAGIPVRLSRNIGTAIELGYMNSGDFEQNVCFFFSCVRAKGDVDGVWANFVVDYPIQRQLGLIGRIGMDFGDDDGLMFGAGLGYKFNRQMELRGEYVIRDNVNSLQANFLFRL